MNVSQNFVYLPPRCERSSIYKGLMHPLLEIGSSVLDPHCVGLSELEKVQKYACRMKMRNHPEEDDGQ